MILSFIMNYVVFVRCLKTSALNSGSNEKRIAMPCLPYVHHWHLQVDHVLYNDI
jgi:hypothetical protein